MASSSRSSASPLSQRKTLLQSSYLPCEANQLGDSGEKIVIMRLVKGKDRTMMAVVFQGRKEPKRWTRKMPKAWARVTVVRKAPRFLGLVYSPIRTERRGDSMPCEMPHRTLPINTA